MDFFTVLIGDGRGMCFILTADNPFFVNGHWMTPIYPITNTLCSAVCFSEKVINKCHYFYI